MSMLFRINSFNSNLISVSAATGCSASVIRQLHSSSSLSSLGSDATPSRIHRQDGQANPNASASRANKVGSKAAEMLADYAQQLTQSSQSQPQSQSQSQSQSSSSSASSSSSSPLPSTQTSSTSNPPTVSLSPFSYKSTSLPPKEDPLLSTFVNLLMRDGKRSLAIRHVTMALDHISASTNSPPLPLLQRAITQASPLVRLSSRKQGGKQVQVPLALNSRQSTRRGIVAIIDASKKRPERELGNRLGKEILNVLDGNSTAIQKKEEAHKMAVSNRANASVRI